MRRIRRYTLLSVAWLLFGMSRVTSADVTIARDGKPQCVIVVEPRSKTPEHIAGRELGRVLSEVTGTDIPRAELATPNQSRIFVGAVAAEDVIDVSIIDDLEPEEIFIRTVNQDIVLCGGSPRATLYAVYTFLEDVVGCRWWSPKVSSIPHSPTLIIPPLDIRYRPPLEYREPFWFSAFDAEWALRHKYNGHRPPIDADHGGRHLFEGFVHTFYRIIPPEQYFAKYPEWFSEIDGKRTHERAQLCLTNDELFAEFVRILKERLRTNHTATIASVSQNDWYGACTCPKCAAMDEAEGSQAGTMLYFVNKVAKEIHRDFPKVTVATLAYQYTRKPPLTIRPRKNVAVWLCSIECSFSVPLTHERNKDFRADIEGWSEICDRMYVWDYTTNFHHYIMPHPNLHVLGPNVKFFVDHGVVGLFEQGAYHSPGAEMMELRAWVLAKLLWNPSLDAEKLIDEFITGYYGTAADDIRAYLDVFHTAVARTGDYLGCYETPEAKYLAIETLAAGWEHLASAEQNAGNDEALAHRIRVAQLPVLYTLLAVWDKLRAAADERNVPWPVSESMREVMDRFMTIAKAEGVTHIAESRLVDTMPGLLKE